MVWVFGLQNRHRRTAGRVGGQPNVYKNWRPNPTLDFHTRTFTIQTYSCRLSQQTLFFIFLSKLYFFIEKTWDDYFKVEKIFRLFKHLIIKKIIFIYPKRISVSQTLKILENSKHSKISIFFTLLLVHSIYWVCWLITN